jgi:hypothetical protein
MALTVLYELNFLDSGHLGSFLNHKPEFLSPDLFYQAPPRGGSGMGEEEGEEEVNWRNPPAGLSMREVPPLLASTAANPVEPLSVRPELFPFYFFKEGSP